VAHTIGGFVWGGSFLFVFSGKNKLPQIAKVLGFVMIIGIAWEFFESYKGMMHLSDQGYWLDTTSDVFFDVFGAYLVYLLIERSNL
jgi:hypothetical protein